MSNALVPVTFQPIIQLILDSVTSPQSKRAYQKALEDFMRWFRDTQPSTGLSKATVQAYRQFLLDTGLSASTINLRLTAIRKLAMEAGDNELMPHQAAEGIQRVPNVKAAGVRTGNWLTLQQAEKLLALPDCSTLRGKRDRALLAVLIGCGLRREEAASLYMDHIQLREARWVIVDIRGKGNRVRSVPMPSWCKDAIDIWMRDRQIVPAESGFSFRIEFEVRRVFWPVNKGGNTVAYHPMSPQSIFMRVKKLAQEAGLGSISPHDLRRTFAKLAHKGHAQLEQIQLSLGHASIQTTERYLGVQQDLTNAPCDHLGIKI